MPSERRFPSNFHVAPPHRHEYERSMIDLLDDYREFVKQGGGPEDYQWQLQEEDLLGICADLNEDVRKGCRQICGYVFKLVQDLGVAPEIIDAVNCNEIELSPFWGKWPAEFAVYAPEVYGDGLASS